MADSVVNVNGGPAGLSRALTRTLENVRRAVDRANVEIARWGVARMVQETVDRKADATSQFKRQWKVVKFPGGAATANTSPYAEFVERGRGPGKKPPIDALEKWLKAKGATTFKGGKPMKRPKNARLTAKNRELIARVKKHGAYGLRGSGEHSSYRGLVRRGLAPSLTKPRPAFVVKSLKGFARALAWKIAKKGTKAKWLLRDVLDEFRAYAASRWNAAVRRVARDPLGRYPRA